MRSILKNSHHCLCPTLLLVVALCLGTVATTASAAVFTVANVDSAAGSLRQAIIDANASAGLDTIDFNIIGAGVHNIPLVSALPDITDRIAIFGYTQGTATPNTAAAWQATNTNIQIQIDGGLAGGGVSGLTFAAGSANSEVRGLAIFDFSGSGVTVTADSVWIHGCYIGLEADASAAGNGSQGINISGVDVVVGGNQPANRNVISNSGFHGVAAGGHRAVIAGNFIGTNAAGTVSMSNGQNGVMLTGGAQSVVVGGTATGDGNLISGNTIGVFISSSSSLVQIEGNRLGTNAAGTGSIFNVGGVLVQGDSNSVGGTSPGRRNIISGNSAFGLRVENGGTLNLIQGNYIGTDPAGAVAIGNGVNGVQIQSSPSNVIGGTVPGARNLISGNAGYGIRIFNPNSTNNDVFLNLIGTNVSGTAAIPNSGGVWISNGASSTRIGDGTSSSAWNVISGNTTNGVLIDNSMLNTVEGNRIGTAISGTLALVNGGRGIDIQNGATNNTIGGTNAFSRNVISGNTLGGVQIQGLSTTSNTVSGNFIGTDITSQIAIANDRGVGIDGAPGNTIGGTTAGEGNVISGNTQQGVYIFSGNSTGNLVYGNTIGTDSSQTSSVPNGTGVEIGLGTSANFIGASGANEGNYVSDNTGYGMLVSGSASNTIQGNNINKNNGGGVHLDVGSISTALGGTNVGEGNSIMQNGGYGVLIQDSTTTLNVVRGNNIGAAGFGNATWGIGINDSPGNTIGGGNLGDRNFISGNGDSGIEIAGANATGNTIQNNQIGGAGQGNTANGIHLLNSASNNLIGGTTLGEGNEISFNGGVGVVAVTGTENEIIGNTIHSNTGMGIDLSADGVTANDSSDVDAGPNNLQNFPIIVVATQTDSTRVSGTFASASITQYRLEFFGNTVCDATNHGEGDTYLGFVDVTTDGSGNAPFSASFSTLVPAGDYITATATDPAGNTSEFSLCAQVVAGPFIVTSPNNTGAGSLRAAINAANANPGPDSIHFNVTGGPYSIILSNALPFITEDVVIDGYTEPGASANTSAGFAGWNAVLMVTLDGDSTVDSAGIFLGNGADNCRIRGLAITRFLSDGISIGGSSNSIEGCKITANSGHGIAVGDGSHVIGGTNASQRNVISGNGGSGIMVTNDSAQIAVYGNLIGTNDSGLVDDGNTQDGVRVSGSALATIGGTALGSGNVISGNDGHGVGLSGVAGVLVSGNRIGTSVDGTIPIGNGVHGVLIVGGGNEVSDNVIAFNNSDGINLSSTIGNQIFRNSIGVDVTGIAPGANGSDGIEVFNSSFTDIGGSTPAQRNIISGNLGDGVRMTGAPSQSNKVYGNYIGTDITGTSPIPNGGTGVTIESAASNNQIGTTVAGTGNLISGNTTHGVEINGSDNNFVQGNSIGVDSTGSAGLSNGSSGVHLSFGASNNTIGGIVGTATNVIAGNGGDGIAIVGVGTSFNVVKGNLIGHDGVSKIPNSNGVRISGASLNTIGGADGGNHIAGNSLHGVAIVTASADSNTVGGNIIGGSPALDNVGHGVFVGSGTMVGNVIASVGGGPGNTITFNGLTGVTVGTGATGTTIRENVIAQNGGLEIDLGGDGVTANDAGDGDVGGNDLQNYPTLTASTSNSTRVVGSINSTPNTAFVLDFYSTDVCDVSGFGGAFIYLGSANVLTNGSGDASYDEIFPTTVPPGQYVTSTATDPNGNTSEFSACSQVGSGLDLQIVSFSVGASATVQDDIANTISLRVRNDGGLPATGTILIGLYHSVDDTIRITDRFVGRATLPTGVGAGAEVDVSFSVAKLPFETPLGAGFMGVIADEFDLILESDETDNTASAPIFINQLAEVGEVAVYFDSLFTARAADCPGFVFDTLYVAAQGLGTFISGAEYKIDYPAIMNFIGDLDTPPVTIGFSNTGISVAWALPQDARTIPTGLHKVVVQWTCDDCVQFDDPITVSAHPNGWIQAVAWPSGDIVLPGGGVSTICTTSPFDLQIVSFSTDTAATVQDDIASSISLRIRNDGSSAITKPILVGLYHSVDNAIAITDRFVSRATLATGLGAGSEVDVSFTTARLPFETPLGAGFMGAIVDEFDTILESDSTNNTASSPISISPLAPVGEVAVYFDSLFTEREANCPGFVFDTLFVAAQDLGTFIIGAEYKIDYPAIMNFIGDLDTPPVTIGFSNTGISVAWALPQDSRTVPTELHRVVVEWTCDDCVQFDDPIIVSAHPNGWLQAVAWPSGDIVVPGGGISTICVDSDGDSVFNGLDLCPAENASPFDFDKDGCVDFDLQIVSFSTDDGASVQDDIASTIELSVLNAGHSDVAGPLLIGLYHSVDDTIRITDRFVSRATLVGGIAAGAQVDVSFSVARLPFETPLGAGFMGVIADEFDLVTESVETNNTASSGIFIDPLAPVGEVAVYFDSLLTLREADCPGLVFDTLYVAAQNLGTFISGAEYKIDYPAIMNFVGDLDTPPVTIGFSDVGISIAWALPQDARTIPTELHKVVVQWTCDDCVQFDDPISVSAHPNGWIQAVAWPSGDIVVSNGGLSTICVDSDGDGVYNGPDLCPLENSAPYDVNGDGCPDLAADNRRIEYWEPPDFPINYRMHVLGASGITDGSEFTEVQQGMSTWNGVAGSAAEFQFGGTTTQNDASPLDMVNLVTFNDPDFIFPSGVLAVGIATSYVQRTHTGGDLFREGQLFDFDMIFNKSISFSTASAGSGPRILGVTVHEAGHGLGFSHSIVQTSAMAYVLSLTADVLKTDDELMAFMHYGTEAGQAAANQIGGTIIDGYTGNPIEAAIVFATSATSGDTSGCALTLNDGSYMFVGLPDDDYFISTHPIDSSSVLNFIRPGNINPLVGAISLVDFVPEFWDLSESAMDNSNAKDLISVSAGAHMLNIDITTNVDNTPPTVVSVSPTNGETDVPIGSAVLVRFSESMDVGTIAGNIFLIDVSSLPPDTSGLGGFVSLDDSLLTLLPSTSLNFSALYELTVKQAASDKFGNVLSGGDFVSTFTTEAQPAVFITSLEPTSGPVGTIVTIEGEGFESTMGDNRVEFDGVQGTVQSASALQLVVEVPLGATSGQVQVFTDIQPDTSNVLPFTVLEPKAVSQGSDAGAAAVGALPRAMAILPDASQIFVATTEGFSIVETDADLPSFLNSTEVLVPGGLDAIDITPVGNRAYAVSSSNLKLYRINVDETPVDVDVEIPIAAGTPIGVQVGPGGLRVFVATDLGEIAIFDINQANTTTFETQVGSIPAVPSLLGPMALAGGDFLLGLSAAGELLVFDLATDALAHQITVGFNPRGVVANPQGDIAYVTDDDGKIRVISLLTFAELETIVVGGSLREAAVTPDGAFLFAVNRELNVFSVIDLRTASSTFHQPVASPSLGINPTAAKIGSNNLFAFATSESEQTVNAVAIGIGPTLETVVPLAAPVGSPLVLAGDGFTADSLTEVSFDGLLVAPDVLTDSTIVVSVPLAAASGPITIRGTNPTGPEAISNAIFFTVLTGPTPAGATRISGAARPSGLPGLNSALSVSPLGDMSAVGGDTGVLYFLDTDPASPTFNQFFGEAAVPALFQVDDVVIVPDGKRTFAMEQGNASIPVVNSNRFSVDFGQVVGSVDLTGFSPLRMAVHPDGRRLYVTDDATVQLLIVDIEIGSPTLYQVVGSIGLDQTADGSSLEMGFHPGGQYLYVCGQEATMSVVTIIDVIAETWVADYPIGGLAPQEIPLSLSFTPDGNTCMVLTSQFLAVPSRTVRSLNTSDPANPVEQDAFAIPLNNTPTPEHLHVSPVGDRVLVNVRDSGYHYFNISDPTSIALLEVAGDVFHHLTQVDFGYTPDATRFYSVSAFRDSAFAQDFAEPQGLALDSGNGQIGIAGQQLPLPIKAIATNISGGSPAAGVAVTFDVNLGGGHFVGSGTATQTVLTGTDGIASAQWVLGPDVGAGKHAATATALGLVGSPVAFIADANADPNTLPLVLLTIQPPDSGLDVAITTNIQATFRRAVDPTSIDPGTFRLLDGSTLVPVSYGFADSDRRVSITPGTALDVGTTYTIELTNGIKDTGGGSLEDLSGPLVGPLTFTFDTEPPPPLSLNSVDPPSGVVGTPIVISGVGINPDPTQNTIMFPPGIPAAVTAAGPDFLNVSVPLGAVSGPIEVERLSIATSGPVRTSTIPQTIEFTVLVPAAESSEEVIGSIGTGELPPRSIAITPDGTRAYATATNSVIKIDVISFASGASIPTGIDPIAIEISPDGKFAYVANNGSNTVSIINVDPTNTTDFETNVGDVNVGLSPVDVVIHPDGDIVYIANSGTNDISLLDADINSATHNAVIGVMGGGGSQGGIRSLSITPDGTLLYVGGTADIAILNAQSGAVIGNVGTGNTAMRSLSITPDGTKLVALAGTGQILVFDIVASSPTHNQVIGVFGGGNQQTQSLSITPDGAQIWAVQELNDEILVLSLDFGSSVGVIEIPETAQQLTVIATVDAGEDPAFVIHDPTGSGLTLVTNPGDKTITVLEPLVQVDAIVHVSPRAFRLWNPNPPNDDGGMGVHLKAGSVRFIEASIELPVAPTAFFPEDIAEETVRLMSQTLGENGGLQAVSGESVLMDEDENGINELHVKFDRLDVQVTIPPGTDVPLLLKGSVDGVTFSGRDTVRTLLNPEIMAPSGAVSIPSGELYDIQWTSPVGATANAVDIFWTPNDGAEWYPIAQRIADTGSFEWITPEGYHGKCRLFVVLYEKGKDIGATLSQEMFTIGTPETVALDDVRVTSTKHSARLLWSTSFEGNLQGFHVLRSQDEESGYQRITTEILEARGTEATYQFDDEDVHLNRTYYYKLQEVSGDRAGQAFGPYELVYRAPFALEQNAPNPFNPTTVIRFTVPQDSPVKLAIYDVAGRLVRTLVNDSRRADHYEVTWDGKDAHGRAVASGVYFYRLQAGSHRATKKMVMLK